MANVPQVIVTLAPNGALIAELPAANGARRQVALMGDCEATLSRILQAQLRNQTELGLDGAPTQAQVKHWERHSIWADPQCRFCIAERGLKPSKKRPLTIAAGNGEVTVRRISRSDTAKLKAKHERIKKALLDRANKAQRDKELDQQLAKAGIVI